ncbi:hypothetical protein JYT31_02755, partial [Beggiatoa alba]|nr:hypothetical protein [Beggiatoa alba]
MGITSVIMAGIVLVVMTLIISNWLSIKEVQERFIAATITGKSVLWKKIITSQLDHMETGSPAVTRDRETLLALKKGTLDEFGEGEGPQTLYNRLSTTGVLDKLQLTDTTGRVKLSFPDDFRGITQKLIVKGALAEGKINRGIERDDDGQLVVASAFPLFVRGKRIGVGIFARGLQPSLIDFKANDGSDVFVLDPQGGLEYATDKNLFSMINLTLPTLGEQSLSVSKLNGKFYSVTVLPIHDTKGMALAYLATVTDYTKSYKRQQTIAIFSYLITAMMVIVSIAGLYRFYKLEVLLEHRNTILEKQAGELERSNRELD